MVLFYEDVFEFLGDGNDHYGTLLLAVEYHLGHYFGARQ